jgi:hypothetical protein
LPVALAKQRLLKQNQRCGDSLAAGEDLDRRRLLLKELRVATRSIDSVAIVHSVITKFFVGVYYFILLGSAFSPERTL